MVMCHHGAATAWVGCRKCGIQYCINWRVFSRRTWALYREKRRVLCAIRFFKKPEKMVKNGHFWSFFGQKCAQMCRKMHIFAHFVHILCTRCTHPIFTNLVKISECTFYIVRAHYVVSRSGKCINFFFYTKKIYEKIKIK